MRITIIVIALMLLVAGSVWSAPVEPCEADTPQVQPAQVEYYVDAIAMESLPSPDHLAAYLTLMHNERGYVLVEMQMGATAAVFVFVRPAGYEEVQPQSSDGAMS